MGAKEVIFATEGAIEAILSEKKTQTRRLIKEGEHDFPFSPVHVEKNEIEYVVGSNGKIKYRIGQKLFVQTGRKKLGLWYCPKCRQQIKADYVLTQDEDALMFYCNCFVPLQVKEIKTMTLDQKINLGITTIPQDNAVIPIRKTTRISNQLWEASTGKTKHWILEQASKEKNYGWKPFRIRITRIFKEKLWDISEEDARKEGYSTKLDFLFAFQKINKVSYQRPLKVLPDAEYNPLVRILDFEVVK